MYRVEDFDFLPGVVGALHRLQADGYALVVISNQSGIARGLYSEADYQGLTEHMRERLAAAGIGLDGVEYCPHLPDAPVAQYRLDCDCRKPKPGLITSAAHDLGVDLASSFMIGDRWRDVEAGARAGCTTILVGGEHAGALQMEPAARVDSLLSAARWIRASLEAGSGRSAAPQDRSSENRA